ncbi:MAG: transcriptional regulator GcvA [Pseudomonadota bacterium]|nr:transcriptional regulator GcvA [Pseudomonadota bacterium]
MSQRLPPLNALRAFEAAARHLSFSRAADELHVTPAAVSHQIKGLEEYLGVQLFRRLNRALQLTEAAQAGLPRLREGFSCLGDAVERICAHDRVGILTVCVTPSFAAKWLVPRLHRFAALHADIDMRISASMSQVEVSHVPGGGPESFQRNGIDVAIRFGRGRYPGFRVDKIFAVTVVPMCSPALLHGDQPLRAPDDLRHHTLLHDDTPYEGRPGWEQWLKAAGVKGVDAGRGVHFNHTLLALEAAMDGQGVVLSLRNLAADDLARGRLVVPFDISLPLEYAYYLLCPETTAGQPKIVAFRDWLLAEAGAENTSPLPA